MDIQMTMERKKAYTELLEILKRVDIKLVNKIPLELMDYFKKNKSNEYHYNYNDNLSLVDQNLNNITKALLAMLNINYWCEDETHKQELIKKYAENERRYQEKLREKYNSTNIFKRHNQEQQVAIIEYKESILKRIINKIKNILHITR